MIRMETGVQQEADLAAQRTDLAMERTILANERTFSAWIRTGLAVMVAGLAIAGLLTAERMTWLTHALGATFILISGGIYALALWRYRWECRHLAGCGGRTMHHRMHVALISLLLLGSAAALLLLFVL